MKPNQRYGQAYLWVELVILTLYVIACAPAATLAPAPAPTTAPAAQATVAAVVPPTTLAPIPAPTAVSTPVAAAPTTTITNPNSSALSFSHPALPKPMTIGDASVDYRPVIGANESTFVRLTIFAASELSSLKVESVAKTSAEDPGFIYILGPRLDLYPWMWAELQYAPERFHVTLLGSKRRPVIAGHATEWVWSLAPTTQARDRHDLTIHIGTIILQADSQKEIEIETVESIPLSIVVQELAPTAVSRPLTAAPAASRGDSVATVIIVMAIMIGIVASLIALLIRQERAERRRAIKSSARK